MRTSGMLILYVLWEALVFLVLVIFFAAGVRAIQLSSGSDVKLKDLYLRAQEAQARGDYRGAAASYREILKLRPDLTEARANLGLMHHLLGEYAEAIQDFEATVRQKPQLFVPNLFLGLDLLRIRQPRRALTFLHRAQQLSSQDQQAPLGLGQAYAALGEYEKANDWYFQAAQVKPKNADALYGLGMTYLKLVQTAARQLGNLGPNSAYSLLLLAESLEQRGRFRDAIKVYRAVVESHSEVPCLFAAFGFANLRDGDVSSAEEQFKIQLKRSPSCLLGRLGLARIAFERDDIAGALKELAESSKTDRSFVEQNVNYLWLDLQPEEVDQLETRLRKLIAGKPGDALVSFLITSLEGARHVGTEALAESMGVSTGSPPVARNPDKASPHNQTPALLYSQGHYSLCTQTLRPKLAQLPPRDLLLLTQCGYYSGDYRASFSASGVLLERNLHDLQGFYWRVRAGEKLAVSALVQAGLADPDSPRVHLLLGDVYQQKQNYKEAEAEYRKAIQLKPDDLAGHLGLAATCYRQLRFDEALPELKKVLELNPEEPEAHYIMGDVLIFRHQYAEAVPHLTAALRGEPATLPHVHALLGKAHAAQGQTTEAVTELKQSLVADRDGSYHFQLYQAYKKLGDQKAAAAALQKSEALRKSKAESKRAALGMSP